MPLVFACLLGLAVEGIVMYAVFAYVEAISRAGLPVVMSAARLSAPLGSLRAAATTSSVDSRLEGQPHDRQADGEEEDRHRQGSRLPHVGGLKEAPAEAADEIDHWMHKATVCQTEATR